MEKYNAIPMQTKYIRFVYEVKFCDCNKAALHGGDMTFDEWERVCLKNLADPDEANFIICKAATPVAWLKINGLQSTKNMAWISMLVVHEKFQHQGIGSFAVQYAEDYVRTKGFKMLGIHTTVDNVAAQNCYKKLGYHVHEEGECTTGDGAKRHGLSLHRDNLDAARINIDGVRFHLGEQHDLSFISKIGKVFCVFDAMDSGNICFGVERESKRYFVKYAGARTQNYDGNLLDAIDRLKNAVTVYETLEHPTLIRLIEHYSVGDGYVAIFDWVNGEGLRSYWSYVGQPMWSYHASPNYRFRHLPIEKRIAVVDKIMAFHQHVIERGYIPVDFYDGSMIYDFDTDDFHICDIDFYRKAPTKNNMGKMWGSTRFMSPEEYELGADLDEKTVVYLMGATAFELLGNNTEEAYQAWKNGVLSRSFNAWSATKSLFDVAMKAAAVECGERYQLVSELISAWQRAKATNVIEYRQLSLADVQPDMLKSFNRYQKVAKCWRKYGDEYVAEDICFMENWDDNKKSLIIHEDFHEALEFGGSIFAAYDSDKLIGFAFYDGRTIGSQNQYHWLVMLHVSYEYRHMGVGKTLFNLCAENAKKQGAKKLYISANSSVETQAFYHAIGCTLAEEVNPKLFEAEPYDVHMEYVML